MDIKKFGHHIVDRLEPNEVMELLRNVKVVVGVVPAKLDAERGVLVGDDGIQVIPDKDFSNVHIERNRLGDRLSASMGSSDSGKSSDSEEEEARRERKTRADKAPSPSTKK